MLLFGGTGMVGTALQTVLREHGHEVTAPSRQDFDAAHPPRESNHWFRDQTVVINATTVKVGQDPHAPAVNALFPHHLARQCEHHGIPLIQLSSDAVFAGMAGPYDETCPRDGATAYGLQKADGEPDSALVLRFSVIGPERRDFTGLLCWLLAQRGSCQGYVDHLWNGLTSLELSRVIAQIIEAGVEPGVRHLHSDTVSKHQLLGLIADAFGHGLEIKAVEAGIRDQRLTTRHDDWMAGLGIRPLAEQIAELPQWSDSQGHWRAKKT